MNQTRRRLPAEPSYGQRIHDDVRRHPWLDLPADDLSVKQIEHRYVAFYNNRRPHQGLDGQTPDTLYFTQPSLAAAPLAEEIIEKLRRMSRPYQTEIVREGERWLVRP
jgi:hypothetical protein